MGEEEGMEVEGAARGILWPDKSGCEVFLNWGPNFRRLLIPLGALMVAQHWCAAFPEAPVAVQLRGGGGVGVWRQQQTMMWWWESQQHCLAQALINCLFRGYRGPHRDPMSPPASLEMLWGEVASHPLWNCGKNYGPLIWTSYSEKPYICHRTLAGVLYCCY